MAGQKVEPVVEPAKGDKRFNDPAWKEEVVFDYLKQSYLLTARWAAGHGEAGRGLDDEDGARRSISIPRQFVDAMSPSNFALTNPQVLKATIESGGENLVKGLKNLLTDLERGKGKLAISMTDMKAFKVGENIATSPGKVVFQNDADAAHPVRADDRAGLRSAAADRAALDQQVLHPRPQPQNSFIQWAVEQGYTVFVISWVNPDEKLAQLTFEDYMKRRAPSPRSTRSRRRPASERSRRSAIASAARCWPRRSPTWRRAKTTGSSPHLLHRPGRFHRAGRARRLHRRGAARRRSRRR